MAEKRIGGAEQFAAHAGGRGEGAHQQEQRDDGEFGVGRGADRRLRQKPQRRADIAVDVAEAEHADEAHGDADRHAQHHQHEQRDKSGGGDGVGTHDGRLIRELADRARDVSVSGANDQAEGAHDQQQHRGAKPDPGDGVIDPHRLAQIEGADIVGAGAENLDGEHPGEGGHGHQRHHGGKHVHRALRPCAATPTTADRR